MARKRKTFGGRLTERAIRVMRKRTRAVESEQDHVLNQRYSTRGGLTPGEFLAKLRQRRKRGFGSTPEEHSRRATMYFKGAPGYLKMAAERIKAGNCDGALSALIGFEGLIARGVDNLDGGGQSDEAWDLAVDVDRPRVMEAFRKTCMIRRK